MQAVVRVFSEGAAIFALSAVFVVAARRQLGEMLWL